MKPMMASPTFELLEPRQFLSAGDLDPSFGNNGLILDRRVGSGAVEMLTQRPGDGHTYLLVADRHGVERLTVSGAHDVTFGRDGRARIGNTRNVTDIAFQPDG